MDCRKVDDMTDQVISLIEECWKDGIAAGDSTTALLRINSAIQLLYKVADEIKA